jgi:hypothetical protein
MARQRALARPLASVIALITAGVVAGFAGLALPAAAVSGDPGQERSGTAAGAGERGKGHTKKDAKGDKASKPEKGDPPGNNGTVKIAPPGEDDGTPDNNPHPGCTFQIEWYGFDEGSDVWSTVAFEMQSPTSDVDLSGTAPEKVFVGGDPATGAGTETGLDGMQEYTLSFDGEPHAKQGYHVKLTVQTPYSQGSDTKHKVFWVEGCDEESESPGAGASSEEDTEEGVQEDAEENDTQAGDSDAGVIGEQADDDTEVLGAQGSTQDSAGTQAADQAAESAGVPTSVDAGMSGPERLRSALPALAVLLGLVVTGATLLHRRHMRS